MTAATLCQVFGKGDCRYAAGLAAMTTLLSMATMPPTLLAGLLVFWRCRLGRIWKRASKRL